MSARRLLVASVVAALFELAGCGGDGRTEGPNASRALLTVSAAASLKRAFSDYGRHFPGASARFSFAGSDELAAQIERGVKPDVYAAANTQLPERLHGEGLVAKPTIFATNRLVLAVPASARQVRSLADAARQGVTLAIGSPSVPVGSYTRTILGRLAPGLRRAILGNVRSQEPDVTGIVGKLTQGSVDAGFVYATDVRATAGRLRGIELPVGLRPAVAYGAAVVTGAQHAEQARAFVSGLLSGEGRRALEAAGFQSPSS